jgi:hypothetical protein
LISLFRQLRHNIAGGEGIIVITGIITGHGTIIAEEQPCISGYQEDRHRRRSHHVHNQKKIEYKASQIIERLFY